VLDNNTDRDWEAFAKEEPYWSVISVDDFRRKNLTAQAIERFFKGGAEHMNSIIALLRSRFSITGRFKTTLDFGCGVGRLLFPLAQTSERAIGLDVSPTMLALCRQNAEERKVNNIELYQSDDDLTAVQQYAGSIDLVTSFIVFQHIPPRRGMHILGQLLSLLSPRACGFLHITFSATIDSLQYEGANVTGSTYRFYQRTLDGIIKLLEGPLGEVQIQMHHYNLNEVMCLFYSVGITEILTRFTNHTSTIGAEFYFQRP
jgi:cyclopropane fatty-acyl-phospholipid synthase-like methyltransferase